MSAHTGTVKPGIGVEATDTSTLLPGPDAGSVACAALGAVRAAALALFVGAAA